LLINIQRLLDPRVVPTHLLASDFGSVPLTAAAGTPGFMAPEQEREGIVTAKTDIYGLGMTFLHLFVPGSEDERMLALYDRASRSEMETLGPVIRSMLEPNPLMRPDSLRSVAESLAQVAASRNIQLRRIDSPVIRKPRGIWSFLMRVFTGKGT
jgi:serine/threonine protein kinase